MNNIDIEFQMFKYWTFWKVSKSKILTFLKKKYLKFSCWRPCTECNGRQFGQTNRTNKQFWHSYKRFKVSSLRILLRDGVSWSTADRKLGSQTFFQFVISQPAAFSSVFVSGRKRGWRAFPSSLNKQKETVVTQWERRDTPLEIRSKSRGSLLSESPAWTTFCSLHWTSELAVR